MAKRSKQKRNNEYYAVIRGFYLSTPTIFSSWGDVHPLVTGFKNPSPQGSNFKGFYTLREAEAFMAARGIENYKRNIKDGAGETTPLKGQTAYYAVANGRNPGVHEYYYGGAEPEVVRFSGACHKHFRSRQHAEAFIEDWEKMHACVVKEKIGKELPISEDNLIASLQRMTVSD